MRPIRTHLLLEKLHSTRMLLVGRGRINGLIDGPATRQPELPTGTGTGTAAPPASWTPPRLACLRGSRLEPTIILNVVTLNLPISNDFDLNLSLN